MAFDIMNLFGKSARNRLLQPAQSAGGMQNFLQNPQAAVEGDPWEGLREVTVDQTQTGAVPLLPNSVQPVAEKKKSAFDNDALRDLFTGWAMGGNDWQKSLALGGTMVAQGRKDRGNRNETVEWLKGRGMDESTARMVAGDQKTLQQYLAQMVSPERQKPLEINGKLVDPTTYQVIADFSTPSEGKDERTANMKELEAAGLKPGTPEYNEALLALNKPKGMVIESDGQGGFRMVQGTDVSGGANLNVEQGKNTGFLIRAQDANKAITALESEGTSGWNKMAGSLPVVGNYMVGEGAQKLTQAKRDFINAVLRQESGAVISPEEFANAEQQYFPQPGDGEEVIAQKRANRENAIKGFRIRSGPGAQAVDQMQGAESSGQGAVVDYRQYFGGQ